ncbi:MAG: hypothetical protein JWP19_1850 [Rhodoglobus sp.]|jgi:hypothetical protein|nr:hypothetical protein [Rhodoglobus sp.]
MTSSSPAALPKKRNVVLVVLDIVAGVVLLVISLSLGLGVLLSAVQYGALNTGCGAGPYQGLTCNSTVLSIVVYGLMAVAVLAFFLGLGFFVVNMVRKRYGFYWPLAAIIVTVGLFYLGSWVAGLTVP